MRIFAFIVTALAFQFALASLVYAGFGWIDELMATRPSARFGVLWGVAVATTLLTMAMTGLDD